MDIGFSNRRDRGIDVLRAIPGEGLHLRKGGAKGRVRPLASTKPAPKVRQKKSVICRECGHRVTAADRVLVVDGSRTHTFFNPAGIVYEIICFSDAPGCLVHGSASSEFTWFAGFTWQVALCGSCLTHLGWLFSSQDTSFYGLILKKLAGDI